MTDIKYDMTAFPQSNELYGGMTLRDWFAGQAFSQAVLDYGEPRSGSSCKQRLDYGSPVLPYSTGKTGTRTSIIARQAYRYADAMMKAREAKDE